MIFKRNCIISVPLLFLCEIENNNNFRYSKTMRGWRNWQTHYLEVVAPARACRFKSCPAHNMKNDTFMVSFFYLAWRGFERRGGSEGKRTCPIRVGNNSKPRVVRERVNTSDVQFLSRAPN